MYILSGEMKNALQGVGYVLEQVKLGLLVYTGIVLLPPADPCRSMTSSAWSLKPYSRLKSQMVAIIVIPIFWTFTLKLYLITIM